MLGKLSLSIFVQIIRCTVLLFQSSLNFSVFPTVSSSSAPSCVNSLPLLIRGENGGSNCEIWHDFCKLLCLSKLEIKYSKVPPSWIQLIVNHGSKKLLSLKNQSSAILIQELRLRKFIKSMVFLWHWDCREQAQFQQRITAVWKGSLIAHLCLMYSTSDYR